MNPATEDFLQAIRRTRARQVFILPNNSNIVMAASQACDRLEGGPQKARVVPSKTILQGLVACSMYQREGDGEDIYENMKSVLKEIRSGSVTFAIKDADIQGVHVTKDYYLAMKDDKTIVSCLKDKGEALLALAESLIDEDSCSLTLIYGEDVKEEEAEALGHTLEERFPDVELNVHPGGQPIYSFLIGVQ